MSELECLFPHRKYWDENSWANFRGFNLDLQIENPRPLSDRIKHLAEQTSSQDDMRVILIPGKLSLEKIRLILKKRNIPLSIVVNSHTEAQIKETEKASIYVIKTDTQDNIKSEENFDLLTLVMVVAASYGTVKGKTVLFEGKNIWCREEGGRKFAVAVTKDEMIIAPHFDQKVVYGTMVKAN